MADYEKIFTENIKKLSFKSSYHIENFFTENQYVVILTPCGDFPYCKISDALLDNAKKLAIIYVIIGWTVLLCKVLIITTVISLQLVLYIRFMQLWNTFV